MNNKNIKIKEIVHSLVDLAIEEDLARMISVFHHEEVYTAIEAIDAKNEKKAEIQASYGQYGVSVLDEQDEVDKAADILHGIHINLCEKREQVLAILHLVREYDFYGRILINRLCKCCGVNISASDLDTVIKRLQMVV